MRLRRRAVMISPIVPSQTGNGLAMRMGMFAEALHRSFDLHVIVVPVAGGALGPSPLLEACRIPLHVIPIAQRMETHFALLSRLKDPQARRDAFRTYGKPTLASYMSIPVLQDIRDLVASLEPDFVHIGRAYLTPCVEALPHKLPVTLDLDEDDRVSFQTQSDRLRQAGEAEAADWLELEGLACDRLISRFGATFRVLFVASHAERQSLQIRHSPLAFETLGNTVAIPDRVNRRDDGQTLLFIGSMSYEPNTEGIIWFVTDVLPRLRHLHQTRVRLLIAGANPPASVVSLARCPGVEVLGEVPDVAAAYGRATLAIAPLHAGGGTRIKVLEAASFCVPSVATSRATSGFACPPAPPFWIADSAQAFAIACHEALTDRTERGRRARNGRAWVAKHHGRAQQVLKLDQRLRGVADET